MSEEGGNLTLRRLEGPIHKFTKVALPTDLERLQRHHSNILKFQHSGQWDRLHQEHINASRTVQVKHRHTHTGLVLSIYSML
ncbi:unnamed protein product [Oncorhynchus mykiss]|uniref:STX17-like N-terminal domain-containing protein n=1 Tax=Oncorhynchus mykiss TaxID=8022 RepID=A0A060ZFA8_ONCMY|nr:unnamed protein product [Oncorhynchus mykiss]